MWHRGPEIRTPWAAVLLLQLLTAPSLAAAGSEEPCGGPLPGATRFDAALLERLAAKWNARDPKYRPRTRHLCPDGSPKYTNRLFLEASPYLLQHAHNPVDWYPWGDEAFELAKKQNRPVLLSVGYSTCHWCHVMEEESFEDVAIATLLNEGYIAVKVDREERPDVDAIYMSAVQALTGGGGWPMTVWLTPDRKPFFGGTYFPARDGDRGVRHGFLTLVKGLGQAYHQQAGEVAESSQKLAAIIAQILSPGEGGTLPGARILHQTARFYKSRFDAEYGGLRGAPKFPSSYPARLLLRYHRRTGDGETLNQAIHTLMKMAAGGIHDQVGGGFHRYATDEQWLVPHFEKMLYDNALLAIAYLEAYQVTKDAELKRVTEKTLRYVERDMTSPEGGFYSATDADSPAPGGHREEGWFFTWTPAEVDQVLEPDQAKLVKAYYQITDEGNFEGRNILHTPVSLAEAAKPLKLSEEEARRSIEASLEQLYQARQKRPPPLRDEKILTAWNGLMISAYARAGLIFNESRYLETARRAADFIFKNLYDKDRLYRSYKDGKARLNGYLDDYASLTAASLDLYEATHDVIWLRRAVALDKTLEQFFEDQRAGGFFMTSSDHEKLLAREKPAYDGAEPSGNSVALLNLLRLQEFTTEDGYRKRAERALGAFAGRLESNPLSLTEMLLAFDFYLDKPKEIIIVTPEGKKPSSDTLMAEFRKVFIPNRILTVLEEGEELQGHAALIPLVKAKRALKGQPTAYVCEKGICELPTGDPPTFLKQIGAVEKLDGSR